MKKLLLLSAILFVSFAKAQNQADIDVSFNHKDELPMFNLGISQTVTQPDGKILAIGGFTGYYKYNDLEHMNVCSRIVRLNADLTIDSSFNSGLGFASGHDLDDDVAAMALQPDGKILVGGKFTTYNGAPIASLIRLNSDGSVDNSFSTAGDFAMGGFVWDIKIQPDNKIIIAGAELNAAGKVLMRLNPDGSIDNSFAIPSALVYQWYGFDTIHLLPDGKILAGGGVINGIGNTRKLFLFDASGNLDPAFHVDFLDFKTKSVIVQPDNKILFVKSTTTADDRLVRLNSDGTEDATFSTGTGFAITSPVINHARVGIKPQTNGDIIVLGVFDKYNGIAVNPTITGNTFSTRIRIHSDGTLDSTFNYQNADSEDAVFSTNVQADGTIVATYNATTSADYFVRICFTRMDANGFIIDNTQLITTSKVNKIIKKSNTEIMALGSSDFSSNLYHNGIKLLNQNGDLAHNPNLKAPLNANNSASNAKIQPDGKILFIGKLPQNPNGNLMRFNADFSTDSSFNLDASLASMSFKELALQADGKILVSCKGLVSGNNINRVVRLNSDGSIDAGFSLGHGCSSGGTPEIAALEIQPDGKIIVGGSFTAYNWTTKNGMVRLNTDGTIDNTFNMPIIGAFVRSVSALAIQPDARIIVALTYGAFAYRLNTDGSLDNSFSNLISGGVINTIAIQADGKIIMGGRFYHINDNTSLLRYNNNGSLDTTFDTGTGFNEAVNSIAIEEDGRILVGGNFTKYNGEYCNGTIRLKGITALSTVQNEFETPFFTIYPNPVSDQLNIYKKEGVGITEIEIFNLFGQRINTLPNTSATNVIDVSQLKSGTYILKINSDKGISNTKFIKL